MIEASNFFCNIFLRGAWDTLILTAYQRYYSVRGKIRGVHPDLKKIGVKEIKIDCENEEIGFIFNEGKISFIL